MDKYLQLLKAECPLSSPESGESGSSAEKYQTNISTAK